MNHDNTPIDRRIKDDAPPPWSSGSILRGVAGRVRSGDRCESKVVTGPYPTNADAGYSPFRSVGCCADAEIEPRQPILAILDMPKCRGHIPLFHIPSITSMEHGTGNDCDGGDSRCNASDNRPEFRSRHQRVLLLSQGACGEGVASTLPRTSEAMISLRERVLAEGTGG